MEGFQLPWIDGVFSDFFQTFENSSYRNRQQSKISCDKFLSIVQLLNQN